MKSIAGRLLLALATLLIISGATFALMRSVPGGPFDDERTLNPAIEENLRRKYRLDEPMVMQYVRWVGNALRGDLGPSFTKPDRTVNEILRDGLPKSALLGALAFCLAVGVGVPLGVLAAQRRARWTDRALFAVSVVMVSVPSFIVASLLQFLIGYKWGLLRAAGWGDSLTQLPMPVLAMATLPTAALMRLVRTGMLEVMGSDYMRTARAKGVSASRALFVHGLRNALLPAVSYAAPLLAGMVVGSFVIEDIFDIPGLGKFFVGSIGDRDYTVIMGLTLVYSALIVTLNFGADLAVRLLDPRLRTPAG